MAKTIREAVAVFDDAATLEKAVYALETHGFDRAAFSLLAEEAAVERKLGHRYRRVAEMEDEPDAPRETFFSKVSRAEAEYGLGEEQQLLLVHHIRQAAGDWGQNGDGKACEEGDEAEKELAFCELEDQIAFCDDLYPASAEGDERSCPHQSEISVAEYSAELVGRNNYCLLRVVGGCSRLLQHSLVCPTQKRPTLAIG